MILDDGGDATLLLHLGAKAESDSSVLDKPASEEERVLFAAIRSEEHTSELQSLMRISYAVFCLKKKKNKINTLNNTSKSIIKRINNKESQTNTQTHTTHHK